MAPLAEHLECLWFVSDDDASPMTRASERVLPDGCLEWIFHLGAPFRRWTPAGNWELQPCSFVDIHVRSAIKRVRAREAANAASKRYFPGETIDETFDKEIRCVCGFVGSFAATLPGGIRGSGPRLLLGSGTPIAHESCGCGGINATLDATSGAKIQRKALLNVPRRVSCHQSRSRSMLRRRCVRSCTRG
jgi:hypothetical protein